MRCEVLGSSLETPEFGRHTVYASNDDKNVMSYRGMVKYIAMSNLYQAHVTDCGLACDNYFFNLEDPLKGRAFSPGWKTGIKRNST
jgi:hypothetical protein